MYKKPTSQLTKILVAVVVAFAALYSYGLVLVIVAGASVYFIWDYHDRIKELENRQGGPSSPSGESGQTT